MPRPRIDPTAVRTKMLDATEGLIRIHGARKVTVSDVAAACGMSQSNAYRFFASRQALLEAVAERWYEAIEDDLATIAVSNEPPAEQLVRFVARRYELKRSRHLEDPDLFQACLELGLADTGVGKRHLDRLRALVEGIVRRCGDQDLIGGRDPVKAAELVEAMTVRFRDPGLIVRHLEEDSVRRAAEAAGIVLAGLAHLQD
ncbi:TetR/AcrR family transcriptional regulator [Aquibium sp. ELW1220]|uniref:TetR/AcrR family transcriptional regulator n=1 Tax=Aquibium sp. ELW1220 TaxID=2976766 RepID=UPI0025B170CC|nr:TetR/AcrR family transcriptional regulator [Aquibium sp. ELW1220]MDN2579989.1 TetR family transcriptional regulator [Aquibium sp. ELW1220]